MMMAAQMLESDFATLPDLVRAHAAERPDAVAAADAVRRLSWSELDQLTDRTRRDCSRTALRKATAPRSRGSDSVEQMAVIIGTLRAGGVAGLVTNSATGEQMAAMIADTGARHLFLDSAAKASLEGQVITASDLIAMDGSGAGTPLDAWLSLAGAKPTPVEIRPEDGFNIIYSSGTTGTPKGIVQSHQMRWQHIMRGAARLRPTMR